MVRRHCTRRCHRAASWPPLRRLQLESGSACYHPLLDQALPEALLNQLAVQVLADEHHLGHLGKGNSIEEKRGRDLN